MMQGAWYNILWAFISACIGCYCLGGALIGFYKTNLRIYERAALIVSAFCLVKSGILTDVVGVVLLSLIHILMAELGEKHLNLDLECVDGRRWRDVLEGVHSEDTDVLTTLEHPYHAEGGLCILTGNLAPEGAVVKQSAVHPDKMCIRDRWKPPPLLHRQSASDSPTSSSVGW